MKVCVLGGDNRQLEIIKQLQESCDITLVGYENLNSFQNLKKSRMPDIHISEFDAIILPVSGINSDSSIKTSFGENFSVSNSLFCYTKKDVLIFTGVMTDKLGEMLKRSNRQATVLMKDEDVIKQNTIPTVEGIIADIVYNTDTTINDSNVFIIGYGNIGKRLEYYLDLLGANITIGVIDTKDLIELSNLNKNVILTTSGVQMEEVLGSTDVIVNTAPSSVLNPRNLRNTNTDAYVLDISSEPYGVDFEYASSRGIRSKLLSGIPSKVAPKTAGLILTKKIEHKIKEGI